MLWQAISWLNRKTEATYRFVPVASARSSIFGGVASFG